jgi:hypothetical protein
MVSKTGSLQKVNGRHGRSLPAQQRNAVLIGGTGLPTLAEQGILDQKSEIILEVLVPGSTPQHIAARI